MSKLKLADTPNDPTPLTERVASNAAFIRAALRQGQTLDVAELAAVANTLEEAAEQLESIHEACFNVGCQMHECES